MRQGIRWSLCALVLLAGCEGPLPCGGPSECHGNACCYDIPLTSQAGPAVYCTASPDACAPTQRLDLARTRLCHTNADCTAGGISTYEATCCPSSVMSRAAGSCQGSCRN